MTKSSLNKCLCGFQKSSGRLNDGTKLLWDRYSCYINMTKLEIEKKIYNVNDPYKNTIRILDMTTNVVYPSKKACEIALDLKDGHVKYDLSHSKHPRFIRFKDYLEENNISEFDASNMFSYA